jgi:hypothetical protein
MRILSLLLASLMIAASSRSQVSPVRYWTGHINSGIPVFIWLVEKDSVFKGQVIYTQTKNKTPITLLGRRYPKDDARRIRICEYLPDATISGIYNFDELTATTTGTWFSPATRKVFNIDMVSRDTVLANIDSSFQSGQEEGDYGYAYGRKGYEGSIAIRWVDAHRLSFEIGCHTEAPAYNLADVDRDTVDVKGDYFDYKLGGSEHCVFRVQFYKHFLERRYLDGSDCQFGFNATVEGIFYKLPSKK